VLLAENGYKNVYNLEHGIMDWELQNLPVAVDPDAKPDTENKMDYEELAMFIKSGKPVFIDFYAPCCGPCCTMMPMIDDLKTKYHDKINIVKVNVDASKKLVKEMKIKGVPYLALYNNGKPVYTKSGLTSRDELEKALNSIQVLLFWLPEAAFLSAKQLLSVSISGILLLLCGVWLEKMGVLKGYAFLA